MKRITLLACLALAFMIATSFAADRDARDYKLTDGKYDGMEHGSVVNFGKAKADTVYILGGPGGAGDGDFENFGAPTDDGWTSVDVTELTEERWNISTYSAAILDPTTVPNHAYWCGDISFASCSPGDPVGGYGNGWNEWLNFTRAVADPLVATNVTVNAIINHDTEGGFDFGFLEYETTAGWQDVFTWDGYADSVVVNGNFTYNPGDYVGDGLDEVNIRWRFTADGAYSDEDCLTPTGGAMQVDLIEVIFGATQVSYEDCETGGTGDWVVTFPPFVGDFAKVWPLLSDIDPCRTNNTPQFAFIDDGIVVPGTGGYLCTTWCYGPGGYIVNPEGGLAGPDFYIDNHIRSPIVAWSGPGYDGAELRFTAYRHESLAPTAPGIFYIWGIRSTDSATSTDIENEGFGDRGFVYYGGPDYIRIHQNVTDLLVQGRTWVQAELGVYELGYIWGWSGTDGYPAPYFDNVNIITYEFGGPAISSREIDRAQDNFPEIGVIDYAGLGNNSVRFDCAQNIAPQDDLWNDPGDSIWFDIAVVRTGATMPTMPRLYYKLSPNPLFDPYRTLPNEGWVEGDSTFTAAGPAVPDRYNFDLPDTGFFYPGDQLHYYIRAADDVGGTPGVTLSPGDTTGFDNFDGQLIYSSTFTVRALPTMFTATPGDQPKILFWNDFANRGNDEESWMFAFTNLGFQERDQFDLFYTNGPSSGVGDGLGGRATDLQLAGYETLLYTVGDLSAFTFSNGDPENDAGNDIGVVDAWLRQGNKNMFLTGDDLVFDLQGAGTATQTFQANWLHVDWVAQDLRPLIGNQSAPTVKPLTGNPVFGDFEWIAYGGCLGFNTFDAVTPQVDAVALAEFLDPTGTTGAYPYSAATLYSDVTYSNEVITMPYDFGYIYTPTTNAKTPPTPSAARARVLEEVLLYFGHNAAGAQTPVPSALAESFGIYPNPFNPKAQIEFRSNVSADVAIDIYDIRGRLVRSLGGHAEPGVNTYVWDGKNKAGADMSSGLYVAKMRSSNGTVATQKMTLLK